MKIRLMSDLHLEFGPLVLNPAGEDVLVLAGDIGVATQGGDWAIQQSRKLGVPVVMIAGNHEFYGGRQPRGDIQSVCDDLHELAAKSGGALTFLQNESVEIAGLRFVGTTLWTDYNLFGDPPGAMMAARRGMNDFRLITTTEKRPFTPAIALYEHQQAIEFLTKEFKKAKPNVVITHHAPSGQSIAEQYARDEYSPGFASNLDALVESSGAALWVHGHVHSSFDYTIGKTRVCVNPRGYFAREINPDFNIELIVEVS